MGAKNAKDAKDAKKTDIHGKKSRNNGGTSGGRWTTDRWREMIGASGVG